jgi:hypothetical protein
MFPDEEEIFNSRVRIVRGINGKLVGYQDPDNNNRFILRTDAIKRLFYDSEKMYLTDSFGRSIMDADLRMVFRGERINFIERAAIYTPMMESPSRFRPASNQEVIERVLVVDKNGRVIEFDTSFGLGVRYNQYRYGGRWRQKISEALGLPENARIPSSDLKRAVYSVEYLVKTIVRK